LGYYFLTMETGSLPFIKKSCRNQLFIDLFKAIYSLI